MHTQAYISNYVLSIESINEHGRQLKIDGDSCNIAYYYSLISHILLSLAFPHFTQINQSVKL